MPDGEASADKSIENSSQLFELLDYAHKLGQSPLSSHTRRYQELFFAASGAFLLTFFHLGNAWEEHLSILYDRLAPWIFFALACFWLFRFGLEVNVDMKLRALDQLNLSELFVAEGRKRMKPLLDAQDDYLRRLMKHMEKITKISNSSVGSKKRSTRFVGNLSLKLKRLSRI